MIIWLASYPKSGNTWVRSFLNSLLFSENNELNLNNILIDQFPNRRHFRGLVNDLDNFNEISKNWITAQEKINIDKKIKFFKTHNVLGSINNHKFTNKENTIGGICIVRDPRNILTSIQNHYELNKDDALKFMINEKKFIHDHSLQNDYSDFQFISSWEKNYQSWMQQKIFPVKTVKYEDLNKKTFETFKEIVEFIEKIIRSKKNFDTTKAKNSIHSTTFSKMKNIEKKSGFVESVLSKNNQKKIPFFNLGPKNDWKNIFNNDYKKKLESTFESGLKDLNYI